MNNFILHCGAEEKTYDQLMSLNSAHYAPLSQTHKPVPHYEVANMFKQSLKKHSDYSVVWERYGVSGKKGTELFGAMGVRKDGDNREDYEMFICFRHSNDQRFSLRGGIGDHFFMCDNMSMKIEFEITGTKHTLNIESTGQFRIDDLTKKILPMDVSLHECNDRYRRTLISQKISDHLINENVRQGGLQKTKAMVVDAEFMNPSYDYGMGGNTLLDLKHAFTHVAKGSFYGYQIKRSQIMHKVFDNYIGA